MNKLYLPALRGRIGDWAYYSTLMTFSDLANRVSIANDIHKSENLSQYIQRQLNGKRAKDIAHYICENDSRFFNSIVVAVYGGSPQWYQLDHIRSILDADDFIIGDISDNAVSSIGFLSLSGEEKLFALDGQHRLIGIKNAIEETGEKLNSEEVPVIFVAHKNNETGMIRTRRLFIDLNKTAKPVKKDEIIALDEADTMAIVTRYLIEEKDIFSQDRILISHSTAMPNNNKQHWTNINNLYDLLTVIFMKVKPFELNVKTSKNQLTLNRLTELELDQCKEYAVNFFNFLGKYFKEIGELYESQNPGNVVKKYRHDNGGSMLFRPIGLLVMANVIADYIKVKKCSLEDAMSTVSKLDTKLSNNPYNVTIWNKAEKKMVVTRKSLLIDLLKYQLGLVKDSKVIGIKKKLSEIQEISPEEVELPLKVV